MSALPEWPAPTETPTLAGDRVHVWQVALGCSDRVAAGLSRALGPAELARAEAFRFDTDRHDFVVRRGVLRRVLAGYHGCAPGELTYTHTPFGQPVLCGPGNAAGLRFSVSSSAGWALIAVARDRAVGVDLERVEPRRADDDLATRFFAPGEVEQLAKLKGQVRVRAFFDCWTRKEAYIKARGEGLSLALDSFGVPVQADRADGLLWSSEGLGEVDRWAMEALPCGSDYAGCVVGEGRGWTLDLWRWSLG